MVFSNKVRMNLRGDLRFPLSAATLTMVLDHSAARYWSLGTSRSKWTSCLAALSFRLSLLHFSSTRWRRRNLQVCEKLSFSEKSTGVSETHQLKTSLGLAWLFLRCGLGSSLFHASFLALLLCLLLGFCGSTTGTRRLDLDSSIF